MKYYCLEICEQHGEREHNQVIRIQAEDFYAATRHMAYWLSHWYSTEDDEACVPDSDNIYYYDCGCIAVGEGFIKEISEATYRELNGIMPDMTLSPNQY